MPKDSSTLIAAYQGRFGFDPEATQQAEARFQRVQDVVRFYESTFPAKLAVLRDLSGVQLVEVTDFFGIMKMRRAQGIGFANNHTIHHRGQLSAYLRAMGSKIPNTYGSSADAEPAAATAD